MGVYYFTIVTVLGISYLAQTLKKKKIINGKFHNSYFGRASKICLFLLGIILIIVAGLRWQVGTDYSMYMIRYFDYTYMSWEELNIIDEPGLKIISKISTYIYDDYSTMFFIASLITVGLITRTIFKYSNMLTFSLLLYIFIGSWHGSFNGVRQYLALAIVFAGHRYIINKSFIKYVAVVLFASTFHITALGTILFYFIPLQKLKFKDLFFLVILTLIVIFSYNYLFDIMESIRGKEFGEFGYLTRQVSIYRVLVSFAPLLIYSTFTNKHKLTDKDFFYVNMLFVNSAATFATSNSAYLMRFVIYINIFMVIGVPILYNFEDKYLRFVLKTVTIILFFLFWYIEVSNSSSLNTFRWIFQR